MDGWIYGWMDGWMDVCMKSYEVISSTGKRQVTLTLGLILEISSLVLFAVDQFCSQIFQISTVLSTKVDKLFFLIFVLLFTPSTFFESSENS